MVKPLLPKDTHIFTTEWIDIFTYTGSSRNYGNMSITPPIQTNSSRRLLAIYDGRYEWQSASVLKTKARIRIRQVPLYTSSAYIL
jgi:hypothetical protein